MRRMSTVLVATLIAVALFLAVAATAQTGTGKTPEEIAESYKAHQSEFDYLLGDWEFAANSQQYGRFRGLWSAMRLAEGQILDEYRVLGDKGETFYVTTTMRAYNAAADRWELIGMDEGNGLQDFGTGRRVGSEMHIEQKFGVAGGKPTIRRIRYYDIRPDRFSWTSDLSRDDGQTWIKEELTIEARRIGPARSLGALTGTKAQ